MAGIDTYTKLLLHGNGTNGGTSFPDSSLSGRTPTLVGTPTTTTSDSRFSGSSMYLRANTTGGGYLTYPASTDFAIGTNDFVVDFWMKPTMAFTDGSYDTTYYNISASGSGIDSNRSFGHNIAIVSNASCQFMFFSVDTSIPASFSFYHYGQNWQAMGCNNWTHYAFVRSRGTPYVFINGNSKRVVGGGDPSISVGNFSQPYRVGSCIRYDAKPLTSYINEYRLSIGTDRGWTTNFIPPIPYTTSHDSGLLASD